MPNVAPLGPGDPLRLGPFVLSGRIGEGGQGVVYLGRNEAGERAAIKLLHVKFSGDAMARSRFGRELRAAQRVASFCTARVIAADLEGDTPYIASEYIDGRSLREAVEESGPIIGPALERLAVGTATALTAIHHAGIVHRDFKPDNVLLAPDGPRVVDFGIARIIDSTGTITSRAIGTPAYMAPEQISGDKVGPPSDVFAWAATIAYAATGTAAFGGDSIAVVLNRVLNHDIDVSMLPEPLRGVVRSCLSKAPAARPTADRILLRLLGRSESGDASTMVLSEGAHAASPEPAEVTRDMRLPQGQTTRETAPQSVQAQGAQAQSVQAGDVQAQGVQAQGVQAQGRQALGVQAWDVQARDAGPAASQGSGSLGAGSQGAGSLGAGSQGAGSQGAGSQGAGSQGAGSTEASRSAGVTEPPKSGPGRRRRARVITAVMAVVAAVVGVGALAAVRLGGDQGTPGTTTTSRAGVQGQAPGSAAPAYPAVVDKALGARRLTIGVKGDLPGVGLGLSGGSFAGFDVDVATYIAGKLGVPAGGITFRRIGRAERARALSDGDVDLVVATYAYDENHKDAVGFAGPYYVAHTDMLVVKGSQIRRLSDLEGRRMCAPAGAESVALIQDKVSVEPVAAGNYAECMDMLVQGRVDAVPGDDLILAGFANRVPNLRLAVLGLKLTDLRYSVGVPKGDARTCEAVQAAISGMYADGTMKDLLKRHFGNVDFDPEVGLPAPLTCA
ncbi:transporter substrate-binding domain-containing protein [Microtetraspora sp. NBRC 16547]|uniref:protein kinase domain-containing protein n=1 Tax=Microtetraspora sp. NBRC 16547 TaxID=3030993 RepID=UPI0024A14654|nr:transporter substrate-binding domain-containing protein [Microtetraspora sp. NBRC 16547]GLW96198.1 hypothetical protein Misp02_02850 [Microtetraspora sp. NBRC 16547]